MSEILRRPAKPRVEPESTFTFKKPEFTVISNLYDDIDNLINRYGFDNFILHFGEVVEKRITMRAAIRIYNLYSNRHK